MERFSPNREEVRQRDLIRQRELTRAAAALQSSPITRGLLDRYNPSLEEGGEAQESEEEEDAHPSPPMPEEDEQEAATPDSLQSVSLLAGDGEGEQGEDYRLPPLDNTEDEYNDMEEVRPASITVRR